MESTYSCSGCQVEITDETKIQPAEIIPSASLAILTPEEPFYLKSKIDQLKDVLKANWDFRFNVITGKVQFREISPMPSTAPGPWRPFTDRDFNQIWAILSSNFFARLDEGSLRRVIESYFAKDFDPVKEYVDSLPSWDGSIDHFRQCAELVTTKPGQDGTWYLYLSRWLIATMATMTGTGINHTCLILLGPQGCGKSTFFHSLGISEELTYTGHIVPGDRDSKILAAEKTIINLDELESSTREDWSFIKSLITLPHITVRRPYGRRAEELPRRASFCGSANKIQILGDLTGSRRWLCTECDAINFQGVTDELKRGVYSQALAMLKAGEKFWFDGDDILEIDRANEKYHEVNHEEEAILSLYEPTDFSSTTAEYMTATQIFQSLKDKYPSVNFSSKKIGQVLKNLNFQRGPKRGIDGKSNPVYCYSVQRRP